MKPLGFLLISDCRSDRALGSECDIIVIIGIPQSSDAISWLLDGQGLKWLPTWGQVGKDFIPLSNAISTVYRIKFALYSISMT